MHRVLVYPLVALLFVCLGFAAPAQARGLPDFTELVEKNAPAVVNISTVGEERRPRRRGVPPPNADELEEFFRFFSPPGRRPPTRSLGSGFIISKDGFILTNNHVVEGASEIVVRFSDRRELVAELVGADARADLAVLKVESDDPLPAVTLGESEDLKVGEWVLAIGSPFGFDYSVTAGIVSAKGRSLPTAQNENYVPYLQTDVAINPGNSGGPLFNLDGEVVGINAQIFSNSGGFMGVSFAIPIDVALDVADQLRTDGRVSRGWLGVVIQSVNRALAESFGLERPYGALINQVLEGSPAQKGGLQAGDVITRFNGRTIERSQELPHFVGRVRAGATAEVELVREGKQITMDIVVGELADLAEDGSNPVLAQSGGGKLGISVTSLTAEERSRLDIPGGVRITSVDDNAAEAGLRDGDVVTSLNHEAIDSPETFEQVADSLQSGKTVPVLVLRNSQPVFVALKVPPQEE